MKTDELNEGALMMSTTTVERCGKRHFEQALCRTVRAHHVGLMYGEETYAVNLSEQVRVLIRSSIRADGWIAGTDGDSIRLSIEVKAQNRWQAVGNEPDSSTTRAPGWEQRLAIKLTLVVSKARRIAVGIQPDEVVRFSTTAQNPGRPFSMIKDGQTGRMSFSRWLDG